MVFGKKRFCRAKERMKNNDQQSVRKEGNILVRQLYFFWIGHVWVGIAM